MSFIPVNIKELQWGIACPLFSSLFLSGITIANLFCLTINIAMIYFCTKIKLSARHISNRALKRSITYMVLATMPYVTIFETTRSGMITSLSTMKGSLIFKNSTTSGGLAPRCVRLRKVSFFHTLFKRVRHRTVTCALLQIVQSQEQLRNVLYGTFYQACVTL